MSHKPWNVPTPVEKMKLGKLVVSVTPEKLKKNKEKNDKKFLKGDFTKDYDFLTEEYNEEDTPVVPSRPKSNRSSG